MWFEKMWFEKICIGLAVIIFLILQGIELYYSSTAKHGNYWIREISFTFSKMEHEMKRYNDNIANVAHGRPII